MFSKLYTWVKYPTQKQVILLTAVWLVGSLLLIISLTDVFKVSLFQKSNAVITFLNLYLFLNLCRVYRNYYIINKQSKLKKS
ncbi:hypothetical protein BN863_6650 [Formosa agariphila KMM 3901]|uniref:Uncharacterized protein n=1 Tax=Formosa agariphila (strain DSM 15362 / KCTC 12365 / LMG 23005 / KMM 3901 / M-2Alg 35-1) TaxID=1347342 RepID=T2KHQ0_FORAG|nr:hypothetical protein BN863_6650 [Formosa agariphila KMM 3901]